METPSIKAAVVHKTWIDGAREVLHDPAARCEFYDAVFDLYFDDQLKILTNPVAQAIFVMTRPYIIADKQRYQSKCERNRQNALQRANASERKRTQATAESGGDNNTSINTSTNTSTNNNISLSLTADEEREKERFDCLGILFAHAATDVAAELQRFIDYYAALGWKNSKGAPIVSKRHAARQWEIKNVRREPAGYVAWYNAFSTSSNLPPDIWTAIEYIRRVPDGSGGAVAEVKISRPGEFVSMLEDKCAKQLVQFVKQYKCTGIVWQHLTA